MQMIITARPRDIGGFSVRRILPYATHRMVGPFIFFDHMGPAKFAPGDGMDVRPHPHIHLATVTYLFSGKIRHRDSLGSDLVIEPGAVNWMTAGRGVVHSERTPDDARKTGTEMNGIQLWVALPEQYEETDPTFSHHPKATLPEFKVGDVRVKLLLGEAFAQKSPVPLLSELFYAEAHLPAGHELEVPVASGHEAAVYVVDGELQVESETLETYTMGVSKPGETLVIKARRDTHVMLLGGAPLGPRNIFWNFVSSSKEKIEDAKAEWRKGPGPTNKRFATIPGDDHEFIPLPDEPTKNPKGTPL